MRLNLDPKSVLEKYHQLYRGERVEDSSGNEWGRVGQFRWVLSWEKFLKNVLFYRYFYLLHRQGFSIRIQSLHNCPPFVNKFRILPEAWLMTKPVCKLRGGELPDA